MILFECFTGAFIWLMALCGLCSVCGTKKLSDDAFIISTAVIVAGILAGGS